MPLGILLRKRITSRNVFLLVASYVFYGSWDWRFLSLIVISTVVDFLCGLAMQRATERGGPREDWRRRAALIVSVVTNLGILGFFKYFG
ncbi:MAG: hypothetical protein ACYTGR_19725, partial [Planctomycetota bacterium]